MIDIEEAFGEDASDIQYRLLATEFEMANGYSMTVSNVINQFIKALDNGEHLLIVSNPDTGHVQALHLHKYGMFIILNDKALTEVYKIISEDFIEEQTHLQLGTFDINYKDTKKDRAHLFMDTCFYEQIGDEYQPLDIKHSVNLAFRFTQIGESEQINEYVKFNFVSKNAFVFNKDTYMGIIV